MDDFQYVRTLRGAIYGKVALVRHHGSGALYAVKMMSIAHMRAHTAVAGAPVREDGDAELRILRRLSGNRVFRSDARSAAGTTATWSVHPQWDASGVDSSPDSDAADRAGLLWLRKDFVDARTNARCLVFDYCPHGELFDYVDGRALSAARAHACFQQIARAVRFVHAHGVAHRDISLENVLVDAQQQCRLADFGLATENGVACVGRVGKLFYMAPEVLRSSAPPHEHYNGLSADVWSLGVLLFVLVTGAPPFASAADSDARFRVVKEQGVGALLRLWRMDTRVGSDLQDLLARMLTVDAPARIAIDKVCTHPWVQGCRPDDADEIPTMGAEPTAEATEGKSRRTRKRMKISIELDDAELRLLRRRGDSDTPVTAEHFVGGTTDSVVREGDEGSEAPALAHEKSPWGGDRQELSALFAPHSTPTAGPRVRASGSRQVALRTLCFTPSTSQLKRSASGDTGGER